MFGASGSIKCTSLKQSGSKGSMNRLKELPSPIWNGTRDTLNVFKSQTPCLHPGSALVHRTQTFVIFTVQNRDFSRMLFEIWRCSRPTCRVLKSHKNYYEQGRLFRDREVTFPYPFRITTEKCQGNLAKSRFSSFYKEIILDTDG